jgi:hypothetical protein
MARQLRSMGFMAACLREPNESVSSPRDVDLWIPYDPEDLDALEAWAKAWPLRHRVAAVINRRERRVMEQAVLNEALGRPGIRPQHARILRDKLLLRETLAQKAPHLNPRFQEVHLASPVLPSVPLPFLLKPRNLFKSQLITLCGSEADWEKARTDLPLTIPITGKRHGVEVEASLVAETYAQGKEFSLDAFLAPDGEMISTPAVELTPARQWGMEDFHVAVRRLPARLTAGEEGLLAASVGELARALELRATPVHVDLVLVEGRTLVLDAAPRIGGYRSEMMDLAHGAPLDPLSVELAMGQTPRWEPRWEKAVAVVEIFPQEPGVMAAIRGLEQVRQLRSFHRLRQRMALGDRVGSASDGFRCPLFVVLAHREPEVVNEDLEGLPRLLRVEVAPSP